VAENVYEGSCFCGSVAIKVTGAPFAQGYCHCDSCRHWSAGPVNAFTLWQPSALTVTRGAENIGTYKKTEQSHRKWCKSCGGHVYTDHPTLGFVDVYAAIIPTLKFAPTLHVFYGEKAVSIKDGLPKFKDLPAEMHGSGVTLPD